MDRRTFFRNLLTGLASAPLAGEAAPTLLRATGVAGDANAGARSLPWTLSAGERCVLPEAPSDGETVRFRSTALNAAAPARIGGSGRPILGSLSDLEVDVAADFALVFRARAGEWELL